MRGELRGRVVNIEDQMVNGPGQFLTLRIETTIAAQLPAAGTIAMLGEGRACLRERRGGLLVARARLLQCRTYLRVDGCPAVRLSGGFDLRTHVERLL